MNDLNNAILDKRQVMRIIKAYSGPFSYFSIFNKILVDNDTELLERRQMCEYREMKISVMQHNNLSKMEIKSTLY